MVSVGTIVWLSSELMFFAGLFAIYFTARAHSGGAWPPPPTELNLYQAVPVTLGTRSGGRVEIVDGLEAGQTVVTRNAFALKSQLGAEADDH